MKYEYIFHAMKVKYMLYINGLLSKNIKKELNKIRDTYLMEVLKSKDVKIASKVKLLANAYTNYIYGKIVDLKNKVWKK